MPALNASDECDNGCLASDQAELLWLFHNQELSHHPVVFVFQDVAVVHVWYLRISISIEGHDDPNEITWRHQDCVFPAEVGTGGWLAVAVENLKLDRMEVERVRLTAAIMHFPNLNVSQSHDLINSRHIHCLAVDRWSSSTSSTSSTSLSSSAL